MTEEFLLQWSDGGSARVVATDGTNATLHSSRQAAVGTPLRASAAMAPGVVFRFKVRDCRRMDDGLFLLAGRWVDLPRTVREQLIEIVRSSTA